MAQGTTRITLIGNVVDDPELRFTPAGHAVTNFRVASTARVFDKQTNEWRDEDSPLFMSCSAWRQQAENIAESVTKGMRVIVTGDLKQRSYETREGEKRTVVELAADEVAVSLLFATAKVTRASRQPAGNADPGAYRPSGGRQGGDPWATPAGGEYGNGDPWAQPPGDGSDEPPF